MWSVNELVSVLPPVVLTSVLSWDAGANRETHDRLPEPDSAVRRPIWTQLTARDRVRAWILERSEAL